MTKPIVAAYKITDTQSGTFYVGSTNNLDKRLRDHRSRFNLGNHPNENLQRGFTSWDNVEVEYIAATSEDHSKRLEQSLINFHHGDPDCANLGTGSIAAWSHGMPEESREKCRQANLGRVYSEETLQRMRVAAIHRAPPSEETCRKLSEIGKGRPHSDEHKRRIGEARQKEIVINGTTYPSIQIAASELKMGRTTIRNKLNSDDPDWNFV
jgi:group I intron endonuclease